MALFGPAPFGLPVRAVTAFAWVVLQAPLFWVLPHLTRIAADAFARGGSVSRVGLALAVARAGPELRRSRAIVIAGLLYLVALGAAWIAYTDSRGL